MTGSFERYFENVVEYPKGVAYDILPWGTRWDYVSSTFLDGLINYVKPINAFVLACYTAWVSYLEDPVYLQYPPGSSEWKEVEGTKQEIFDLATQPGAVYNTCLRIFDDDVLVLAECSPPFDVGDSYYFFWFDQDVSDCCIGRFKTTDSKEVVIEKFVEYVRGLDVHDYGEPRELPLHFFNGWISF